MPHATDVRTERARALFRYGWGDAMGVRTFAQYLARIPLVPAALGEDRGDFPDLVLEDQRPFRVRGTSLRIVLACRMLGVACGFPDGAFTPTEEPEQPGDAVRWIRLQDGRRRRGLSADDALAERSCCATVFQGLSLYAQRKKPLFGPVEFGMLLPGTTVARSVQKQRGWCACLSTWCLTPYIARAIWDRCKYPRTGQWYGPVTRWVP